MNPTHGMQALRNQKLKIIQRIKNLDPGLATSIADIELDWYRIRNVLDPAGDPSDTTEVLVYDEIGGVCGLSAENFVRELNDITTPKITVRINSPGGSLFDSIAIYNALISHPAHVTTQVDALAASGASIIAMAGDECVMMVGSQLMIHDAMGVEIGNAKEMRAMADFLDMQSQNIATVYSAKAGSKSADEWRVMMLDETWMFADEAVNLGLADRVFVRPEAAAQPDEDEHDDEDGDSNEPDSPDDSTEFDQLMYARFNLANRGFKHAGRNKAPIPLTDKLTITLPNQLPVTDNSFADLYR